MDTLTHLRTSFKTEAVSEAHIPYTAHNIDRRFDERAAPRRGPVMSPLAGLSLTGRLRRHG